jgi:hypothetical protein
MAKFGKGEWRLPTREELRTLVYCSNGTPQEVAWNYTCDGKDNKAGEHQRPTINQIAFPNTSSLWYWSSTEKDASGAWDVYFDVGYLNWDGRYYDVHVRLVRSGQ